MEIKIMIGTYAAAIAAFLYGTDPVNMRTMAILGFLILADLIYGGIVAWRKGTFTRRKLVDGICRKVGILFMIAMAHMIDVLGIMDGIVNVQAMTTIAVVGTEMVSVLDKIQIAGTTVPKVIIEAVKKIVDRGGKPDESA